MDPTMACPVCAKKQRHSVLIPRQINFDDAIYLCSRKKCKYPEGYPWLLIKRDFKELQELVKCAAKDPEETELQDEEASSEIISANIDEVNNIEVTEMISSEDTEMHEYNDMINDLSRMFNQDPIEQLPQETAQKVKDSTSDFQVSNQEPPDIDDAAFELENLLNSYHKGTVDQPNNNENSLDIFTELDELLL